MADILWSDLHQDFKIDAQGRLKLSKDIDSVMTSIDNILRTYKGERVMLPEFASRLKDLVFEPIDSHLSRLIADEIKEVIEYWDDRVTVSKIDMNTDPDRNFVSIVVHFLIRGYSETFTQSTSIKV